MGLDVLRVISERLSLIMIELRGRIRYVTLNLDPIKNVLPSPNKEIVFTSCV